MKLHEYEPIEKYKNFSNPTTKPIKGHDIGFHEKHWTLRDQILHRFHRAAKLMEVLFTKAPEFHNREETNRIVDALSQLNNNIYRIQNSVETSTPELHSETISIFQQSIDRMRRLIDQLRPYLMGHEELRNLARLNHLLTELEHLLSPSSKFKNYKQVMLYKVKLDGKGQKVGKHAVQKVPKKTGRVKSAQPKKGSKMVTKTKKRTTTRKVGAARKTAKTVRKTVRKTTSKRSTAGKAKTVRRTVKKRTIRLPKAAMSVTRRRTVRRKASRAKR